MKIENFRDCLKVSRVLERKISPWEIAYNCLFIDNVSNDSDIRHNSEIARACDAYLKKLLKRSKTIQAKLKLLREVYPWRRHISTSEISYKARIQCEEEILDMSIVELWKISKEVGYDLSTQTRDKIFEQLFWRVTIHQERMDVIKEHNGKGSDLWIKFLRWSLQRAKTQKERWEIYSTAGGYGIGYLEIKRAIEDSAKSQLEEARSKEDIWKVYKEAPPQGETSIKAFRLYIEML